MKDLRASKVLKSSPTYFTYIWCNSFLVLNFSFFFLRTLYLSFWLSYYLAPKMVSKIWEKPSKFTVRKAVLSSNFLAYMCSSEIQSYLTEHMYAQN